MTHGTKLEEIEGSVRALLFSREPPDVPGLDEEKQRLYRRLVRTTLSSVVKNAIPRAKALLGDEATDKLIASWLEQAPPTTRILRDVPEEFVTFCQSLEDPPHPALAELVHWEVLEIQVTHAPDAEGAALPSSLDEDAGVESHPSARLAAYLHPVHGLAKPSAAGATLEWPRPSREPSFLVAYRSGERFHWVAVPKLVAQVLLHTGAGLTLGEAFTALEKELQEAQAGETEGAALRKKLDRGFVRSWLVNLQRRGALLGFPQGARGEAAS